MAESKLEGVAFITITITEVEAQGCNGWDYEEDNLFDTTDKPATWMKRVNPVSFNPAAYFESLRDLWLLLWTESRPPADDSAPMQLLLDLGIIPPPATRSEPVWDAVYPGSIGDYRAERTQWEKEQHQALKLWDEAFKTAREYLMLTRGFVKLPVALHETGVLVKDHGCRCGHPLDRGVTPKLLIVSEHDGKLWLTDANVSVQGVFKAAETSASNARSAAETARLGFLADLVKEDADFLGYHPSEFTWDMSDELQVLEGLGDSVLYGQWMRLRELQTVRRVAILESDDPVLAFTNHESREYNRVYNPDRVYEKTREAFICNSSLQLLDESTIVQLQGVR